MAKNENQKFKSLMVAKILDTYSDLENPITPEEVADILNYCGIPAEYRSVLRDIHQLDEFYSSEIPYEEYEETLASGKLLDESKAYYNRGWMVVQRPFEYEDIQVLIECVNNAKFISNKQADELKNKLGSLRSVYEKEKLLKEDTFTTGRYKTTEKSIFLLLGSINDAIEHNHKLSFIYKNYRVIDGKIQKVDRRDGKPIVVSPYKLMMNDSNYYLVCFDDRKKQIFFYRVDRMENTKELNEKREGYNVFKQLQLNNYVRESFNMYNGKRTLVKMRFTNDLLYTIIDRFGTKDIKLDKDDPTHFYLETYVYVSDQFYGWLWGFGRKAVLLEPEELVEEFIDKINVHQLDIVKAEHEQRIKKKKKGGN